MMFNLSGVGFYFPWVAPTVINIQPLSGLYVNAGGDCVQALEGRNTSVSQASLRMRYGVLTGSIGCGTRRVFGMVLLFFVSSDCIQLMISLNPATRPW
jgi:hypothetical protein